MLRPQGPAEVGGKQKTLRQACQAGDLKTVKDLLEGKPTAFRSAFTWLLNCTGNGCASPVKLDFTYEDDSGNLPLHYVCQGPPLSRVLKTLSMISSQRCKAAKDCERAVLLQWLISTSALPDLGAVNLRLESAAHCALLSNSFEVLKVVVAAVKGNPLLSHCITGANRDDVRPLDLALQHQQWEAAALLIGAGALDRYPPYQTACDAVDQLLPGSQLPRMGRYAGLTSLSFGLQKILFRPLPDTCQPSSSNSLEEYECDERGEGLEVLDGTHALLSQRRMLTSELSLQLSISEAHAAALLARARWVIPDASGLHEATLGSAVPSSSCVPGSQAATAILECCVCFESFAGIRSRKRIPCNHFVCDSCWTGILQAALDTGELQNICCPHRCEGSFLCLDSAEMLLNSTELARLERLLAQQFVDTSAFAQWCPRVGCEKCILVNPFLRGSSIALEAAEAGRSLDVQCSCGESFCFSCLQAPHEPCSCSMAKQWAKLMKAVQSEEAECNEAWVETNTKPCTGCNARIQRISGCNHMVCTKCRHKFCWECGDDWSKHSGETGGSFLCNRSVSSPEYRASHGQENHPAWKALNSLLGKLKSGTAGFRLSYFIRRYRSCEYESMAEQVGVATFWMETLVKLCLPQSSLLVPGSSRAALGTAHGSVECIAEAGRAVVGARRLLQHSYVAAFFGEWGHEKRIFEELQSRILEVTETLMTLLLHLPDLQKLLELAEAWRRKGGRAKGGAALAEYMLKSLSKEVWQHQLCYALALHRRRTHLEALVAAVKAATSSFRQKMQSGYFDTASVQPTRTPYGGEGNLGAHPASAREVLQNLGYAALHFWGDR